MEQDKNMHSERSRNLRRKKKNFETFGHTRIHNEAFQKRRTDKRSKKTDRIKKGEKLWDS